MNENGFSSSSLPKVDSKNVKMSYPLRKVWYRNLNLAKGSGLNCEVFGSTFARDAGFGRFGITKVNLAKGSGLNSAVLESTFAKDTQWQGM